jgi:hypothetical protein
VEKKNHEREKKKKAGEREIIWGAMTQGKEKKRREREKRQGSRPDQTLQNKSVKTDLVQFTHKIKVWSGGGEQKEIKERERE